MARCKSDLGELKVLEKAILHCSFHFSLVVDGLSRMLNGVLNVGAIEGFMVCKDKLGVITPLIC